MRLLDAATELSSVTFALHGLCGAAEENDAERSTAERSEAQQKRRPPGTLLPPAASRWTSRPRTRAAASRPRPTRGRGGTSWPSASSRCRRDLPQAATSCHKLPKIVTSCHNLPKVATSSGRYSCALPFRSRRHRLNETTVPFCGQTSLPIMDV